MRIFFWSADILVRCHSGSCPCSCSCSCSCPCSCSGPARSRRLRGRAGRRPATRPVKIADVNQGGLLWLWAASRRRMFRCSSPVEVGRGNHGLQMNEDGRDVFVGMLVGEYLRPSAPSALGVLDFGLRECRFSRGRIRSLYLQRGQNRSAVLEKLFGCQPYVLGNLPQQRGRNVATFVQWNGGAASVGMAILDVGTTLAHGGEASLSSSRHTWAGFRTGSEPILRPRRCSGCRRIRLPTSVRHPPATWQ